MEQYSIVLKVLYSTVPGTIMDNTVRTVGLKKPASTVQYSRVQYSSFIYFSVQYAIDYDNNSRTCSSTVSANAADLLMLKF